METIAIVGVGLIGGSLGLALQEAGFTGTILGVSSERSIASALELGAIHAGAGLDEAAARADVIYLAQPIAGILKTIERLAPICRPNTLITDAGSTKFEIVRKAGELLTGCRFLGGHPMAGKEARGVEAADPGLFRNRTYCFTPVSIADLDAPLVRQFTRWIERCGAKILTLSPEDHDRTVAFTSHVPQLLSTVLAVVLAELPVEKLQVAGPGAIDMTRLALSAFDIWSDIIETNRDAIDHALTVYIDKLTELRDNLQTPRVGENFRVAASVAARLRM
jgi:prephenate dehydrogenase